MWELVWWEEEEAVEAGRNETCTDFVIEIINSGKISCPSYMEFVVMFGY